MLHLLNHSVYQDTSMFGGDPEGCLAEERCDGLEVLTSFEPQGLDYRPLAKGVHLPYASDWMSAWRGDPYPVTEGFEKYYTYGKGPQDVVDTVTDAIRCASLLGPSYGVLHLCNVPLGEILCREFSVTDAEVVATFCEMINTVVSGMQGCEPPFRLAFENLWWPGLMMVDDSQVRYLERHLEFDNWSICLDTGHLMSCIPDIRTEQDGIDAVLRIADSYSSDTLDRITNMHFHWSASWDYRSTFVPRQRGDMDYDTFIREAHRHVSNIDRHNNFTDVRCNEIVEAVSPDVLVHEMTGPEDAILGKLRAQRSLMA